MIFTRLVSASVPVAGPIASGWPGRPMAYCSS
jgi:hypothetical protein